MNMIHLTIMPLMAIIHLFLMNSENTLKLNKVSLFWSLIQLFIFTLSFILFNNTGNFQFAYIFNWIQFTLMFPAWGSIIFMVDGMALPFLGLSILLMPMSLLMSWSAMNYLKKEFLMSLFSILLFLMVVFTIMDLLGFYMLFESILIPMFLMMGMWGTSGEKVKAAYYFFFYTLIGSLLMLMSIFKIYSLIGSTNYLTLMNTEFPPNLQYWIFMGFFMSLAMKIPMFPIHIWLPQAHVEAPISGSVLLAGMLLKLGGYGFISFSYPMLPMASEFFSPMMITLSIMAIIYAALTTCSQTDMKSLIAYSSVSHMGLVTLSMFMHNMEGLVASILMMMAHGLISSGLFMTSAILYTSFYTSTMKYFKGMTISMPMLSIITFILMLSNMSFPMTLNFMAEFLSILVAFNYSYLVGSIVCLGVILNTTYSLLMYNKIYFGTASKSVLLMSDLLSFEFSSFIPLITLILMLGILPNVLILSLLNSCVINMSL